MVFVEYNYSTYGAVPVQIKAKRDSVEASVDDLFELQPIEVKSLDVLSDGPNPVTEMVVSNNIGGVKAFNWMYDTEQENITSTEINITDTCFVFIQGNQSSGVYVTTASISSTINNDTQSRVIVI